MSTPVIRVVKMDDWLGLYIDGELKYEGHSIDEWHLFDELKRAGLDLDAEVEWNNHLACATGRSPADYDHIPVAQDRRCIYVEGEH